MYHTNTHAYSTTTTTHAHIYINSPPRDSDINLPVLTMYLHYFFQTIFISSRFRKGLQYKQPCFLLFYFSHSLHLYPICHNFLKLLLEEWNRRLSVGSCDLKSPCTLQLQVAEKNGSKPADTEGQGAGWHSSEAHVGWAPTTCESTIPGARGNLQMKATPSVCTARLRDTHDLDVPFCQSSLP